MHRSWSVRSASNLSLSTLLEGIIAERVDELSVVILLQGVLLKLRWTLIKVCTIFDRLPVPASTIALADYFAEKGTAGKLAVDVRMCKDCQRTIFSKSDFAREVGSQPADQRAYQHLVQFEQGIRLMLPRFQRQLQALQDPEKPTTPAQLAEASKVRKRLTDAFTQYDTAARRIRDMPTDSPTQARLQKAVHTQAANFLHVHMLPLKSVPKILKQVAARANANGSQPAATVNGWPQSALSSTTQLNLVNGNSLHKPDSSRSSISSTAMIAMESEEKELRERLAVLEEQKFMVSEMVADANKRRKFDEVASLARNVDDLDVEIGQVQAQLGRMDFAGMYAGQDGPVK